MSTTSDTAALIATHAHTLLQAREDQPTVTVHLPLDIGNRLIEQAGIVIEQHQTPKKGQREGWPATYDRFRLPNSAIYMNQRDEALTLALAMLTIPTIKTGDYVLHHSDKTGEVEEWEVLRIETDGLVLEDDEGGIAYRVSVADVQKVEEND